MNLHNVDPVSDPTARWTECTPANTIAVVVTYGSRVTMAVETLARIFASGIGKAVLVDNGLRASVREDLVDRLQSLSGAVIVERLESNEGSAAGFAAGIKRAVQDDAEFIWMLDDDNHPQPDAFLHATRSMNLSRAQQRRAAISCLRTADPSHMRIAAGEPVETVYPKAGEFFGFDLLSRLSSKFPRRSVLAPATSEANAMIPMAPYGGLLVSVSDVDQVGPPDGRFVLYCDDYDFTQRLVSDGVVLQLVSTARVDDAGQRWDGDVVGSNMKSMMTTSSGWRAYYLFRNLRVLESRQAERDGKRVRFLLNGLVFSASVLVRSIAMRRLAFMSLYLEAQSDARKGKLGLKYQLPQ